MSRLASIIHTVALLFGIEPASTATIPTTQQEATNMAEEKQNGATPAADSDALLANVKKVLTTAGHDVEQVWDEVVALAKKLS